MKTPSTMPPEFEPESISEEAQERQERDEAIIGFFERAFHILNAYQAHQHDAKNLLMSTRAMEFALGFHLAAGADGLAELARKCHVSKQALGKCVNHFIAQLSLEPLPFQRKAEARKHMSEARKQQVKHQPKEA